MIREVVFVVGTIFLIVVSRKSVLHPGAHGFYRFLAWECMLALALLNVSYWFKDPFAPRQIASWLFLCVSLFLVAYGVLLLKKIGKPSRERSDDKLIAFEKTSALVTVGAYKYIRHPLYASLLFLAWGIFFKHLSWPGMVLVIFSTLFLFLTARRDEAECLEHFGAAYRTYMQETTRFIPFLF
ncbi:MAG: isoprenylcysteine carboxylmethyltransferase family protein [Candidatus Aminicenantes bacterium]|nr:isoprenylcysteine carboxylmethyltransferase family protein [Candidatus Aminicenantes bacterium]